MPLVEGLPHMPETEGIFHFTNQIKHMDGWLKLHRSILDCKQFANPTELKIWIWLLCKASISDRFLSLKIGKGVQTISLKRGQFIFGRNKAEIELSIDGSTIYKIMQRFQLEKCILIESNNQYSIITVNNYNDYQQVEEVEEFEIIEEVTGKEQPSNNQIASKEQPTSKQVTAEEQASNKQVTQYKKVKEGIEGKEGKKSKKVKPAAGNGVFELPNYKNFVDCYFEFYKNRNGGPPHFNGRDGEGIKKIAGFMRNQAKAKHPAAENLDDMALGGFKWILSKWDLLTPYLQQKISPGPMSEEINSIFNHLKNNNGTAKQATGGAVNLFSAFSKVDAMPD